jgi:hypothetical protein
MLRANGDGVPVGGESEIRAGVAILGGGPAGAAAAEVIRRHAPDLSAVVFEHRVEPGPPPGGARPTEAATARVQASADHIDRLHLDDGRTVVAHWYLLASPPAGERTTGENWLSLGGGREADPPTSQANGRDAGSAIVALHRGEHDRAWLLWSFHETARRRLNEVDRRTAGQPLELHGYNVVKPNLTGAQQRTIAEFRDGKVHPVPCYTRDGSVLPITGVYKQLLDALKHHTVVADVLAELQQPGHPPLETCIDGLEAMLRDGWLIGKLDRRRPLPAWPDKTTSSATISTFPQSRESIRK